MNLNVVKDALLTVGVPVSHFTAIKKPDQYIVWAEAAPGEILRSDNKTTKQAIAGTIDYFTKIENDPNVEKIQKAINDAEISWELYSIQYEEDTKYIHYEWLWEVA